MKKIIAIFAVVLVTGCSSMGMGGGSNATAGRSDMHSMQTAHSMDREPVIKTDGNLSLYHGG